MAATDQQVQNYVDTRIRPIAEQIRAVKLALDDAIASIDDVYAALTAQNPTWTDQRTDAPPHLLTGADVLAINTMMHDVRDEIAGNAQLAILLKACVRAVTG